MIEMNSENTEKSWVQYERDEIEKLVVKLAREGNTKAKIGIILRDQYGIPSIKQFGTRISDVVDKEIKREIPEDLFNRLIKVVDLYQHLEKNKKDAKSKHSLDTVESKIRRLAKYYIRKGKLPKGWKYSIEKARLLVK